MNNVSITIVTPAFNEAENLPVLYEKINAISSKSSDNIWEWIIVDDHSNDSTFAVIQDLARQDQRVRGIRLSRNSGSHTALWAGLLNAHGDCALALVADLQNPPETMLAMIDLWRNGAQVVWAVRHNRRGESLYNNLPARFYYWTMRRMAGLPELPSEGADFFLIDRRVVNVLKEFKESNVSVMALLTWVGFRQASVTYDKQPRQIGRSGWTFGKKLKLAIDSIASFSFFPIRCMSLVGMAVAASGFIYAIFIVANKFLGNPAAGWSELMVALLVLGGLQMFMVGILGEYMWRTLDESRRRPRYIIEEDTKESMNLRTDISG